MNSQQKGFGALGVVIIIMLVGVASFAGWVVYDRNTNNSSTETETTESAEETTPKIKEVSDLNASSFTLDSSLLPVGWTPAPNNGADLVTIYSEKCFIEATKEANTELSASQQSEGVQKVLADNNASSSKGYITTDKGTSTLEINTTDGLSTVKSYEYFSNLESGDNPFRFSRAISVQDGYAVSLKRSCDSEEDFPLTIEAIKSIIFNVN